MLKNPVEILLLISVYALSCNISFLFGLLLKSWSFQLKNSMGNSEKCHLLFFPVKGAVSDEQTSSTRCLL